MLCWYIQIFLQIVIQYNQEEKEKNSFTHRVVQFVGWREVY